MIASRNTSKDLFGEINITPLTDIFLVLLIIMMVVAPAMTQARNDILPPEISGGDSLDNKQFTVEVALDGRYYVDGYETNEDMLAALLAARAEALTEKQLIIRADRSARSKAVIKLLEIAKEARFERAILVGERLRLDRQETSEEP